MVVRNVLDFDSINIPRLTADRTEIQSSLVVDSSKCKEKQQERFHQRSIVSVCSLVRLAEDRRLLGIDSAYLSCGY